MQVCKRRAAARPSSSQPVRRLAVLPPIANLCVPARDWVTSRRRQIPSPPLPLSPYPSSATPAATGSGSTVRRSTSYQVFASIACSRRASACPAFALSLPSLGTARGRAILQAEGRHRPLSSLSRLARRMRPEAERTTRLRMDMAIHDITPAPAPLERIQKGRQRSLTVTRRDGLGSSEMLQRAKTWAVGAE